MSGKNYRKLEREILEKLDIPAEYERLGVRFSSPQPRPNGWRECHAVGREDRNPSAAVYLGSEGHLGLYKDLGGTGESCSFFDFASKHGAFRDWRAARRHFAKQVGLGHKLPKGDVPECPEDKIHWTRHEITNPLEVRGFCKRYGVTPQLLREMGCKVGRYPKDSHEPYYVIGFPVHGPLGLDEPPRGWVIASADGRFLYRFRGDADPEPVKRLVIGTTGLVGGVGLRAMSSARVVIKCEGLTDMLTIQTAVPTERRLDFSVITNACGTHETTLPGEVKSLFKGKEVWVIHDCDEPGQNGAELWVATSHATAKTVRNVRLPYPVSENHGKDVRDWFSEGHRFSDLEELAAATEAYEPDPNSLPPSVHRQILKRCGIVILGIHDGNIVAFSEHTGLTSELPGRTIDKMKLDHLILYFGQALEDIVDSNPEPDPAKVTLKALRRAMVAEASDKRLDGDDQRGRGVWEFDGRAVLVGRQEVLIYNGKLTRTRIPLQGTHLFDLGASADWYSRQRLERDLVAAKDPKWRTEVYRELASLFSRWDNWAFPDHDPQLVASLAMATWMQTVWNFRPIVTITGPTNCGKSWLFEKCLKHLFGNLTSLCSKPSEAGLRQSVGHTASVVLIDEFEKSPQRQRVWELLRTGTSHEGGAVIKGTSNQRGRAYRMRHIPWLGSIESGLSQAADRNRAILIELKKVNSFEGRQQMTLPKPEEIRDLGERTLTAILSAYREVREMGEKLCMSDVGHGIDRRQVEAFALPVAVSAVMEGLDDAAARLRLETWLKTRWEDDEDIVSDEQLLIQDLLQSQIDLGKGVRTTAAKAVGALLRVTDEQPADTEMSLGVVNLDPLREALQAVGLKIVRKRDNQMCLFIAPGRGLDRLLSGSDWPGKKIGQILRRIPGTKYESQRLPDMRKGYSIPAESFPYDLPTDDGSLFLPDESF